MKKAAKTLSIIIPAYNEQKILKNTLDQVRTYLTSLKVPWEILVVDDGSNDKTYTIAEDYEDKRVKAFKLSPNQGKGAALKKGVSEAGGEYIVYMDADLSVPLTYLTPLVKQLEKTPIAIGSRRTHGATIEVHQPFIRESLGRAYTFITRVLTGVPLTDFTCGFKGFQKNTGKKIFSNSKIERWGYDAEIMFLANKYGYKISEVPVTWKNREDSRVRLSGAVVTSLRDLIKVRLFDLVGNYD